MSKATPQPVTISFRVDVDSKGRIGPGKAALMDAINNTGSISAAAKALGMSYPRALKLVDELNALSVTPLILKQHGGANRGGAALSPTGQRVLACYQQMREQADRASRTLQHELATLICDEST